MRICFLLFFALSLLSCRPPVENVELPTQQLWFQSQITAKEQIQEPLDVLDLPKAMQLVLQMHPRLQSAQDLKKLQNARSRAAKVIPNPQLEVSVEDLLGTGAYRGVRQSQWTLLVSQTLELGQKAASRKLLANAQSAADAAQFELDRLDLLSRVAKDFTRLFALQLRMELETAIQQQLQLMEQGVQKRIETEKDSPLQLHMIRIEMAMHQMKQRDLQIQIENARRTLALHWGNPKPKFVSVTGAFVDLKDISKLKMTDPMLHPEVRLRQAVVAQWQAQKQVEASAAVVDPSIQLGVRAFAQDTDTAVVIGFSLPLPAWDRRKEAMEIADTQVRLARRDVQIAQWSIIKRSQEALDEIKRRHAEILDIKKKLLPLIHENIALVQEGFALGKFTLIEMLEARRLETELQFRLIDAREALQLALIELEFLTGIPVLEGKQP